MKIPNFLKKHKKENIQLKKTVDIDPLMHWKSIVLLLLAIVITSVTMLLVLVYAVKNDMLVNDVSKREVEALKLSQFKGEELNLLISMFSARDESRAAIINSLNQKNVQIKIPVTVPTKDTINR